MRATVQSEKNNVETHSKFSSLNFRHKWINITEKDKSKKVKLTSSTKSGNSTIYNECTNWSKPLYSLVNDDSHLKPRDKGLYFCLTWGFLWQHKKKGMQQMQSKFFCLIFSCRFWEPITLKCGDSLYSSPDV